MSSVCFLSSLSGINEHLEYRDVLQAVIASAVKTRMKIG